MASILDIPGPLTADDLANLSAQFEADRKSMKVRDWMDAASHLFNNNPEEFAKWEQANPEWGIRFHAQADKGRGNLDYSRWNEFTGMDGVDHAKNAQAMAYMLTQQDPRYGADGKVDGGTIAFNYNDWDDIGNESGTGDFFKLGNHASFTDDLWSQMENNPELVAGLIATVAAPWAAPAIAGATGLSTAMSTGLLTGGSQLLAGADWDDALLAGVGGWAGGGGLDGVLSGIGIDPTSIMGQGLSGMASSALDGIMPGESGGTPSSGGGSGLDALLPLFAGAAGGYFGSQGGDHGGGSSFNGNYRTPQRTGEMRFQPVDYGPMPKQRAPGQYGELLKYAMQDAAPALRHAGGSPNFDETGGLLNLWSPSGKGII